ncbi:hypothetical protein [Bradyrhizobium sp. Ce-3]|uniref:hypothetical protein n=1 Tax=Bradyrhizobium sp. Ce-3 TaxID=2913970 RepID=UPI001FBB73A5|nr:hypothetical protein [Bradyrhizobium sp. Ce-3]GKQ50983.1 hypothetical protein BRSPCE3_18380 [Bradyrhizobium sp. Ce-3]
MPITRKPLEIPPKVARQFAADMQAYHAERDDIRRDRTAVGNRHMLLEHMQGLKLASPMFLRSNRPPNLGALATVCALIMRNGGERENTVRRRKR